jgi:PAS domain S-box-containing protein
VKQVTGLRFEEMTLRTKTLVIIGATLLGLVLLSYVAAQFILLDGFTRLEEQEVGEDVERVRNTLANEFASLQATASDYAHWDDTYSFAQDANADYIEANLFDATFINLQLNLMVFLNTEGQIIFAKAVDLNLGEEISISQELQTGLEAIIPLLNLNDEIGTNTGIARLAGMPMLIASTSILTSQAEGPSHGTLIMGRYLDESYIQRLAQSTQSTLTYLPYDLVTLPADFQAAKAALSAQQPVFIHQLDEQIVAGYSLMEDIAHNPTLILRVDVVRDVYAQGRASISYLILSLVALGGIFGIVILLLLEKTILSGLANLSTSIRHMGSSSDLSIRVPVIGKDELAGLAEVINGRLETLEDTQKALHRLNTDLEQRISQRTELLQRTKDRAEAILNNTSDAIVVTQLDGTIRQANPGFNELFGYEADEAFGVSLLSLFDSSEQAQGVLDTVTNVNQSRRAEIIARRKDGTTFQADLMLAPIRGESNHIQGIICSLRDITERARAEERQNALIAGLRAVVVSTSELMDCPDVDTLFRCAVEMGRSSLGLERCAIYLTEDDAMHGTYGTDRHGKIVEEHTSHFTLDDATWRERLRLLQSGGPQWISVEEALLEWDGQKAVPIGKDGWIAITPIPAPQGYTGMLFNDNGLTGLPLDSVRQEVVAVFCSLLGNIYQRKRLEEDLRRALEKEQELNELKSRFSSMISHEFRTPLATIQSSSDLLKTYSHKMTEERKSEHLESIISQVGHLTSMLDDILTLSKAQTVGVDFRPIPIDLEDLCSRIAQQIQQNAASTHSVAFSGTGRPLSMLADEKLLIQAITNLLTNAVKYSPNGGSVYLDLLCEDEQATIRVRDEGIGIPEEDQSRLFEIFHRANNVGSISGTGLGLAITRHAVEKHGGKISVMSQAGDGTTFTVTLPLTSALPVEVG